MGSNFNIQFTCDLANLVELKEKDIWCQGHVQLVIQETNKIKRKDGWIWRVVDRLDKHGGSVEITERDSEIIIDFYDYDAYWCGMSREDCYMDAQLQSEHDRLILKKLRIKNYNLTYEYHVALLSEDIFNDDEINKNEHNLKKIDHVVDENDGSFFLR